MEILLTNASIHICEILLNGVFVTDEVKETILNKLECGNAFIGLATSTILDLDNNVTYEFTFDVDEFTEYEYCRK